MVADYHSCLSDRSVTGFMAFSVRLMEATGFKPLVVHYSDMNKRKSKLAAVKETAHKLQFLLHKPPPSKQSESVLSSSSSSTS